MLIMSSAIFSADKPFTHPIIPQKKLIYFLDAFPEIKKTMVRSDIDSTWNYHFVDPNNQIIFKTISMLLNKNMLVSPITLKSYLPSSDVDFDNLKYELDKVEYKNK